MNGARKQTVLEAGPAAARGLRALLGQRVRPGQSKPNTENTPRRRHPSLHVLLLAPTEEWPAGGWGLPRTVGPAPSTAPRHPKTSVPGCSTTPANSRADGNCLVANVQSVRRIGQRIEEYGPRRLGNWTKTVARWRQSPDFHPAIGRSLGTPGAGLPNPPKGVLFGR